MENIFRIYRPLIFLCGPAISETYKHEDRRILLFNQLLKMHRFIKTDKYKKSDFYTIPVIVDDVLDKTYMAKHHLEYKTTEEIIAVISQKTYIFLDSLSSTYELGLFDNSLSKSSIVLFLEKGYDTGRHQRRVGDYITNSIKSSNIIQYDGVYDDEGNEYVSFPKDEKGNTFIPDEILKQVKDDFDFLHSRASSGFKIVFTSKKPNHINEIGYHLDLDKNNISFSLSVRLAFYLTIMFFSKNEIVDMSTSNTFEAGFSKFKAFLFNLYLTRYDSEINKHDDYKAMLLRPDIHLNFGLYDNASDIFKYFICIAERISYSVNKSSTSKAKLLRTKRNFSVSFTKDNNYFYSLLNITKHEINLINDYIKKPDDYVDSIIMKISGKNRKIIKYKNSHKGRHLRRLHEKIGDILTTCLPPSKYAFAYKKNSSTKLCLDQHINSMSFAKLDIHSFFNSIKLIELSSCLKKRIVNSLGSTFGKVVPSFVIIERILRCCFYYGNLPLGFVTSPILSDIYMHDTDLAIGEKYKDFIYTRYADDILISSSKKNKKLKHCSLFIKKKLDALGLEMNRKKKAIVRFANEGDSIHYIGANIVFRNGFNELTISKKAIVKYCHKINKECCKTNPDYSKIKGMELYIKNISEKSFLKLCEVYLAIFKTSLPAIK